MRWNSRPSWIWDDAVPASRANADANSHFSTRLRSFIRSSASAATLGFCFCELLAGFSDEKVGGGEHRLARCARDDEVAALHGQSRYSVESVGAAHLRRTAQLAFDRERAESGVVFGCVHVPLREPVRDPFGEGIAAPPQGEVCFRPKGGESGLGFCLSPRPAAGASPRPIWRRHRRAASPRPA